jgi:hypothetical protein
MILALDKETVEARIANWQIRLQSLCEIVKGFAQKYDCPLEDILEGQVLQRLEQPMIQFQVQPKMLPTIAILKGMNRVSLVPSVLWILGADGRVNVSTNSHQYILVDTRKYEEAESDWRIATSKLETPRPFVFEVFKQLLETQELD